MRSGIVHHKSDRKSCVIPTADRNSQIFLYFNKSNIMTHSIDTYLFGAQELDI